MNKSIGLDTVREAIEHELENERNIARASLGTNSIMSDLSLQTRQTKDFERTRKGGSSYHVEMPDSQNDVFRRKVGRSNIDSKESSISPRNVSINSRSSRDSKRRKNHREEIRMNDFLQNKI